ncbi:STAS domain-containing protein [Saccharopolyspora sp. NPDC047091]|uniref:STAS domain-containing protein n=1 Tax=Saccharopolyspora sp. NPDC047091 TaxID=3155924 RepID=UPI0033D3FBF8
MHVTPVRTTNALALEEQVGISARRPPTPSAPPRAGGGALGLELHRPDPGTILLAARGELDAGNTGRLRELLWHRLASCTGTVVLDLSEITFVDTACLHLLDQCQRRADQHDISFRVVLDERGLLDRLLELADVQVRFLTFADLPAALR